MFRYLGSILVVVLVLVLVVSLGVILFGRVAAHLSSDPGLRLTAFDGVGPVGGPPPRLRAWVEGSRPGRPSGWYRLVARFEDGRSAWMWVSHSGLGQTYGLRGLTAGAYPIVVGLPEVHPRLDLTAGATVYVRPKDGPVIWFDAAAIVPACGARRTGGAVGRPPEGVGDVIDVAKTLASGCLPVYLVSADAQGYASARRRLKAYGAPPGPAFWVMPGKERSRLLGLKRVWPRVRAAVVCHPVHREMAARMNIRVADTVSADALPGPAAMRRAWRRILETLTAQPPQHDSVRR